MTISTSGEGAVLPPESLSKATLETGTYKVTIDGFDDSGMLRCVYPGEFVKHHQVESVEELAVKVMNQLRGRFAVNEITFVSVPGALEAGESFTVEV